jgi:hypothetical protein
MDWCNSSNIPGDIFFLSDKGLDKLLPALAFPVHIYIPVRGKLYYQCGRVCDLDTGVHKRV